MTFLLNLPTFRSEVNKQVSNHKHLHKSNQELHQMTVDKACKSQNRAQNTSLIKAQAYKISSNNRCKRQVNTYVANAIYAIWWIAECMEPQNYHSGMADCRTTISSKILKNRKNTRKPTQVG